MKRIVVSPKACAVAAHLAEIHRTTGDVRVDINDRDVAAALGLAVDTVYRAVVELDQLRAIHDGGTSRTTGVRSVLLSPGHWVFTAVAQAGQEDAA